MKRLRPNIYIRTEINPQFVGIIPPSSRVIVVSNQIEFDNTKGVLEIMYPYSTLFPVRDKLFPNFTDGSAK